MERAYCMKNFLRITAIILFSSFAVTSGSYAATHNDTVFFKNTAAQIDGTSEMVLPLFSGTATASICDMNEAVVESTEIIASFPGMYNIHPDELDAVVVNLFEDELQMSIEPSNESQGVTPDFACMDPPYNCPANVKSEFIGARCVVTHCGTGACPSCPSIIPGLAIKSWCSYGCIRDKKVVGGCFGFWSRIGNRWLGPFCIAG